MAALLTRGLDAVEERLQRDVLARADGLLDGEDPASRPPGPATLRALDDCGRALRVLHRRLGLLDGDIYGPNLPRMLGVRRQPSTRDGKVLPLEAWGLKFMSMGLLVDEGEAVVWRGPMLHGAIKSFLHDVEWGELDYLLVDLPPGTGDVQLSLIQQTWVSGAVVPVDGGFLHRQDWF